jgi:hypothetical protein
LRCARRSSTGAEKGVSAMADTTFSGKAVC